MTKKWLALFSVLSLVVFLGAGCGDESSSTTSSNSNSSAVEDTTDEKDSMEKDDEDADEDTTSGELYSMDEAASVGDVTYEVTAVELLEDEIPTKYHNYPDTIGEPMPADDGRDWLRVEVSITNDGTEKASLFGSNFIVENGEGQRIESSNDVTSYAPTDQNPVLESDIQSGATKDYIMYFDIPEGSEDLVFEGPNPEDAFGTDIETVQFSLDVK